MIDQLTQEKIAEGDPEAIAHALLEQLELAHARADVHKARIDQLEDNQRRLVAIFAMLCKEVASWD